MEKFNLENGPKIESGFKAPENYFETFSANLIQKLPTEPIPQESKVISIFRKRKKTFMAVAAVFAMALMIPIAFKSTNKDKDIDSLTLENYLSQENNFNEYEIIKEIEPESNLISTSELGSETIEEILVRNPNIENLVIEN